MEADVNEYLSDKRALAWRLNLEKFFTALEDGNATEMLPDSLQKVCAWVFSRTTAENRIGSFGQKLLMSEKMDTYSEVLKEPVK